MSTFSIFIRIACLIRYVPCMHSKKKNQTNNNNNNNKRYTKRGGKIEFSALNFMLFVQRSQLNAYYNKNVNRQINNNNNENKNVQWIQLTKVKSN